jgi:Nitroreductase family
MIVTQIDHRTVRSALELATRAPSVHNSQPWRWRIADRSVHLYADNAHQLPATDPDGAGLDPQLRGRPAPSEGRLGRLWDRGDRAAHPQPERARPPRGAPAP